MNLKRFTIVVVCALAALVSIAKPTLSGVAAKTEGCSSFIVSYKLAEKGYDPEESSRFVYGLVFENATAAKSYLKTLTSEDAETDYDPIGEISLEEELGDDEIEFDNGSHAVTRETEEVFGLSLTEAKSEYPKAVVAVVVEEECYNAKTDDYDYTVTYATAQVKYGTTSASVSERALAVYGKSQTLTGVYESEETDGFAGTVSLKLGAINKKTGAVKVTATLTPFSGKKLTASATATLATSGDCEEYDEEEEESVAIEYALVFKSPVGEIYLYVDYNDDEGKLYFEGEGENGYYLYTATVGGTLEAEEMAFVDGGYDGDIDFGDGYDQLDVSADGEPIFVTKGTKWSFNKSPTIKYKKYTEGSGRDKYSWYELVGPDDTEKTNYSGLKLTYTAKTGVFKGSYYIYASNADSIDEGKAPKLQKIKVTVSGVVVNGVGYGTASAKINKVAYSWSVGVE